MRRRLSVARLTGVSALVLSAVARMFPICWADSGNFSVGRARNAGLVKAQGEFVVMHDADIVLHHGSFLESLVSEISGNDAQFLATTPVNYRGFRFALPAASRGGL